MLNRIKNERFIAILRGVPQEKLEKIATALYDGGIRLMEVTFNPSDRYTMDNVSKQMGVIRSCFGEEVGLAAGTVVEAEFVTAAKKAGADVIVSPNTDEEIIRLTKNNGMISIPGAYSPTEIVSAYKLGADLVKIFPVLPHQLDYLKTITSPLSHIPFIVTGGIRTDNAADFLNAGATAVAAGATLIPHNAQVQNDYAHIRELAQTFTSLVKSVN